MKNNYKIIYECRGRTHEFETIINRSDTETQEELVSVMYQKAREHAEDVYGNESPGGITINGYAFLGPISAAEGYMTDFNIAAKSEDERDKVNVDLAAAGVAYKERMNQPVVAEMVAREQPEHLKQYFIERLAHYREVSKQLPNGNAPVYQKAEEGK